MPRNFKKSLLTGTLTRALFGAVVIFLSGCSLWKAPETEPALDTPASAEQPAQENHPAEITAADSDPFSHPPSLKQIVADAEKNAETGESDEQLKQYGRRWLYGGGMGRTMTNVGTVVAFPPYALYLVGNAGLSLAGYEQLSITSLVPEPARDYILGAYNGITSLPGRLAAFIAGEEFQQ